MKRIVLSLLVAIALGAGPAAAQIYNHTKTGGVTISAAAALADNTATPTSEKIGAFGMVYDGSTWDFLRGYYEDAAETAGAQMFMCGAVMRTTKASSAGTTGDNATINVDGNGGLWLAADVIEDAAETAAAPLVGVGAVRRDTQASSAGTTGDNSTLNTDNLGALYTTETGHQSVASGIITVATAGTSVQGATVTTKQCWFQTAAGATGTNCFLGAATGDNRNKGLMLIKGAVSVGPIPIQNLNLVWADCATSGDTVQYFCTN